MDDINQLNDIVKLFSKHKEEEVKNSLIETINLARSINDPKSKKVLKKLLPLLLEYILESLSLKEVNKFIFSFNTVLNDLCILFPDITNEFFRSILTTLQDLTESNDILESKGRIINLSILMVYLTNELKQPNQFLANYIHIINTILSKIDLDDQDTQFYELFMFKCILLKNLQITCSNINSYNPYLTNQLLNLLGFLEDSKYESTKLKVYNLLEEKNLKPKNFNKIKSISQDILLTTIQDLMKNLKEDLNFDIIFKQIVEFITNKLDNNNPEVIKVMQFYNLQKILIKNKKNIQINFLTIKRKPIQTLEPELEDDRVKDMSKILEKKLKKTKLQAIRNLKKEALVIDVQKQKTNRQLYEKRREEQKISNQFVEQSKLEDKKLMTGQDKKRYKLKKNK